MGTPQAECLPFKDLVLGEDQGPVLRPVDILLVHSRVGWPDWLLPWRWWRLGSLFIRWATRGEFNHAALVFLTRRASEGYHHTFVMESTIGGGVDILPIQRYLCNPRAVVAIKRVKAPWFHRLDTQEQARGERWSRYERRARGLALEQIQDAYDHRLLFRLGSRLLGGLLLATLMAWRRLFWPGNGPPPMAVRRQGKGVKGLPSGRDASAYICSGLVAAALFRAVEEVDRDRPEAVRVCHLQDVVFLPHPPSSFADLLSSTPVHLAVRDNLAWLYLVVDGRVHTVNTYEEVRRLAGWR